MNAVRELSNDLSIRSPLRQGSRRREEKLRLPGIGSGAGISSRPVRLCVFCFQDPLQGPVCQCVVTVCLGRNGGFLFQFDSFSDCVVVTFRCPHSL